MNRHAAETFKHLIPMNYKLKVIKLKFISASKPPFRSISVSVVTALDFSRPETA